MFDALNDINVGLRMICDENELANKVTSHQLYGVDMYLLMQTIGGVCQKNKGYTFKKYAHSTFSTSNLLCCKSDGMGDAMSGLPSVPLSAVRGPLPRRHQSKRFILHLGGSDWGR